MNGIDFSRLLKEHKCNGCVWGTWTEVSYKCLFPGCLKGLWSSEVMNKKNKENEDEQM